MQSRNLTFQELSNIYYANISKCYNGHQVGVNVLYRKHLYIMCTYRAILISVIKRRKHKYILEISEKRVYTDELCCLYCYVLGKYQTEFTFYTQIWAGEVNFSKKSEISITSFAFNLWNYFFLFSGMKINNCNLAFYYFFSAFL